MKQLRNLNDVIGMGNVEVGRIVPVQAMKKHSRSGGVAPLLLNFGTRYR
jgi:hypothetical protein